MRSYHDEEWGVPLYESEKLWGKLMLDGFQAGLSWAVVLNKREAIRRQFRDFDPVRVARFGPRDVARILDDPGVIRSRTKIASSIRGAKAFLTMRRSGEEFGPFVWGLVGGRPIQNTGPVPATSPLSETISDELRRRGFTFVGPTIVYAWMQATGMVNDHAADCFRRAPTERMGRGTAK